MGIASSPNARPIGPVVKSSSLSRSASEKNARARRQVGGGLVAIGEETGRLDDQIDAQFLPRQLGRVALAEDANLAVAHLDAVVGGFDGGRKGAVD